MSGEVIIVGMGPGPLKFLTKEAEKELLEAGQVFFRMSGHPVFNWLRQKKVDCVASTTSTTCRA